MASGVIAAPSAKEETDDEPQTSSAYPLMMIPTRQTKTVHFIRHGQGFHNVAGAKNHENYKSEEW